MYRIFFRKISYTSTRFLYFFVHLRRYFTNTQILFLIWSTMNILINMFTELQQQGFQRYGSSTARTSQRQGSWVWVFQRWESFYGGDLSSPRIWRWTPLFLWLAISSSDSRWCLSIDLSMVIIRISEMGTVGR